MIRHCFSIESFSFEVWSLGELPRVFVERRAGIRTSFWWTNGSSGGSMYVNQISAREPFPPTFRLSPGLVCCRGDSAQSSSLEKKSVVSHTFILPFGHPGLNHEQLGKWSCPCAWIACCLSLLAPCEQRESLGDRFSAGMLSTLYLGLVFLEKGSL